MAKKPLYLLVTLSLLLIAAPPQTQAGTLSGYKICLDPGHGGADPGAVYDDGIVYLEEADINLDVAYGLKALLESDGATVVMARTDDSYKDNRDRYTFCNDQQATILVSVHTNSTTDPLRDGSMALYFHADDKVLAQAILDVMYPALKATAPPGVSFTSFGLSKFASGVLLKSDMPAAMMEPVFMSNPDEGLLLTTTMHQVDADGVVVIDSAGNPTPNPSCQGCRRAQIAGSIHQGILSYFGQGPVNEPPTVIISSPADGASFDSDALISFAGSASDTEDGDLTANLAWTSSRDGNIGIGDSFNVVLSDGTHTITASVIDSGGLGGEDSITITVGGGSGEAGGMYVWDISFAETGRNLKALVTIKVDSDGDGIAEAADAAVGGADVSFTLAHEAGTAQSYSGTTDSSGQARFQWRRAPSGTYTGTVTGVSHATYVRDETLDQETSDTYVK
jgi:N-acetylmuramoyl-L-alanine amidase